MQQTHSRRFAARREVGSSTPPPVDIPSDIGARLFRLHMGEEVGRIKRTKQNPTLCFTASRNMSNEMWTQSYRSWHFNK